MGFFSLVEMAADFWAGQVFVEKGFWLDHIFLMPEYIGLGIGSKLIAILKTVCLKRSIGEVHIFSDPHAKGFFDKLGAEYQGESPPNINPTTKRRLHT